MEGDEGGPVADADDSHAELEQQVVYPHLVLEVQGARRLVQDNNSGPAAQANATRGESATQGRHKKPLQGVVCSGGRIIA